MDPKHNPSPDDPNRHPPADKPEHAAPKESDKPVPPTSKHGKPGTDPMVEQPVHDDSLVDLSMPGAPTNDPEGGEAPPPSGISVIEWAALVEKEPPTDSGSLPKIDAPSDIDWKKSLAANAPPTDKPAEGESKSDSAVDLLDSGEAPTDRTPSDHPEADEPTVIPGSATDEGHDEPDVLADDLEIVRSAFSLESSSSDPNLKGKAGVKAPDTSHTGEVELATELPAIDDPLASSSSDLGGAGADQEPDLAALMPGSSASGVELVEDVPSEDSEDAEMSGVHLTDQGMVSDALASAMLRGGEGAPSPDDSNSGRDLIAEEVESGVHVVPPGKEGLDEELETEAGQAPPGHGDPLQAGTVESAVIEAQLVEDVVHEEDGDKVALGTSAKTPGQGSSVNLSSPPKKKGEEVDTGDMEMGMAAGHVVSSQLDFSHVPEIEDTTQRPPTKPLQPDEVDFGSEEDIHMPASGGAGSDVLTESTSSTALARQKPAKRSLAGSPAVGWVGGGLVGAVVTAGVFLVLWFMSGTKPPPSLPRQQAQAPTFEAKLGLLRNGDFEKAAEAGIQNIDENNPEQVAARGEYRWLSYFKQSRVANTPIKVDDDPVKQALEDFGKVASNAAATPETKADVLLWTGHIHEMAGDTVKAGTTYQTAAAQFAAEPALKRRFDVALIRLGLQTAGKPAGIGRLPADEQERLLLVALLLPMLQEPVPPTTKPESQEAGYDFWEAVALARDRKFADALKKLDSARNLHDKRRFAQLRKSQNPMSDPNEDIFIRACDELRGYWQLQERLRAGGYLQAADEPGKAVETLISYVKGFRDLGDKLVKEKVVGDAKDLEKGIDQLLADRKNVEAEKAKVAKLADALVKAKVIAKPEDLEQGLTKLLTDRAAAEKQVADLNTAVKEAQAEAKKEKDLVTAAEAKVKTADELKKTLKQELVSAKYIDANADDQKIIQGLKDAIKVATTDSSKEAMRKLQVELTQARDQMAAHGDVLKALALRNEHKYAEAKTALEKAKSSLAKEDKPFQDAADAALKEVSNLGALYLARADALQNQGKYEDAVGALTRAVEISPQDKGALLAKRSLVELAAAKDKATGKLIGNEPMVTAAKKDAEEASTAGAAMGHYAAGRVAEELGDYNAAVQSYRQAVAAQPDPAGDGSLFRIALARVLLMSRPEKPAVPKDEPKLGLLDRTDKRPTPEAVMLLFAFTLQPPLGQQPANVEEANKLADEILKLDKSKVPYEVRAQALAIKNLWTEALRNYAEGLKANLDRQHADELMYLLDNHPKLKGPDSERIANPLMAEAHYGAGIRHYFNKRYSDAEKEFALAIKNESQDARYHYFLGLSRLAQDKNEAYEDFAEGALLEARGRPSRAAVSVALERVQGPVRTLINAARDKVR